MHQLLFQPISPSWEAHAGCVLGDAAALQLEKELEIVRGQLREVFPNFDQAVELQVPMFFKGGWTAEMAHRLGQSGCPAIGPGQPYPRAVPLGYDCIGYGMAGDISRTGVEKALYTILGDQRFEKRKMRK